MQESGCLRLARSASAWSLSSSVPARSKAASEGFSFAMLMLFSPATSAPVLAQETEEGCMMHIMPAADVYIRHITPNMSNFWAFAAQLCWTK